MAAITQITPPMAITPIMLSCPVPDTDFNTREDTNRVAMAMPDTGLLEEPTRPTRREETVANRNPNTAINSAPRRFTGTAGTSQITTQAASTPSSTTFMGRSWSVRRVDA